MYAQEKLIKMKSLSDMIDEHVGLEGTPERIEFEEALKGNRIAILGTPQKFKPSIYLDDYKGYKP